MKNLFLLAAGVDQDSINSCTSSEKNKYKTLGALVYVPLVTGIVSIIFATLYFTHNPFIIALVGLAWGGVIFTIERALISSLRPGTLNFAVFFRVISAFAMSLIISELLIMFVFRDQIAKQNNIGVDAEMKRIHEEYAAKIASLQDGLKKYGDDLSKQEQSLIEEIEGIGGSLRRGDGKVAAEKRKALERKKALYKEEKRRIDEEIALLRKQEAQLTSSCETRREVGLLGAIMGLHNLSHENRMVKRILLIMHAFFLTVELMPLVLKVSFKGSQYYDMIEMKEQQHLDAARQLSQDETNALLLKGQYQLRCEELNMNTQSLQADVNANCDQYAYIAEALLKAAQRATEMEKMAAETVQGEKLVKLKNQLNNLYENLLQTAQVAAA